MRFQIEIGRAAKLPVAAAGHHPLWADAQHTAQRDQCRGAEIDRRTTFDVRQRWLPDVGRLSDWYLLHAAALTRPAQTFAWGLGFVLICHPGSVQAKGIGIPMLDKYRHADKLRPMTKQEAIDFFGSQAALGRAIGRTQSTISELRDPLHRDVQIDIELATNGKLRADLAPEVRRVLGSDEAVA